MISGILDIVVPFYLFHRSRLGSARVVGTPPIALPDSIARGVMNQIVPWKGWLRARR